VKYIFGLFIGIIFVVCCSSTLAFDGFIAMQDDYFVDSVSGEPLGVWQTHDQIDYDLDEMVKMGANSIRVDFVWLHIEAEGDNIFEWENYDYLIQACEERDIRIFPLVGYQWPPAWFPDEWYTMHPPGVDGEGIMHTNRWQSDIISYEHPDARAQYAEFFTVLCDRYKDSKAIAGWLLGNEYGYLGLWSMKYDGYDPWCVAAFRDWCSDTYTNIGAVNAIWGTSLTDFDEIDVLDYYAWKGSEGAQWADIVQWHEDSIASYVADGAVAARVADTNHLMAYSTVGMQWGNEDHRYHAEDRGKIARACVDAGAPLAFFAINNYCWPLPGHESRNGQWGISYTRKIAGVPVIYSETGFTSSETLFAGVDEFRQGPLIRNALWESYTAGTIGSHVFTWQDKPFITDREKGFGIVTGDRVIKPAYWATREQFNLMKQIKMAELLAGSVDATPDIAFLWPESVDSQFVRYEVEMLQSAGAFERLGYEPNFILSLEELASGAYTNYGVVVLPRNMRLAEVMPGPGGKTVLDFLREDVIGAGVHVLAIADLPGQQDNWGRPRAAFKSEVDALFGIDASDVGGTQPRGNMEDHVGVDYFHKIDVIFNTNAPGVLSGYSYRPGPWKFNDRIKVTDGTLWAVMDSGRNRGFEMDPVAVSNWVVSGQAAVRQWGWQYEGDNMLHLWGDSSVSQPFSNAIPGETYTADIWLRNNTDDPLTSGTYGVLMLEWYDAGTNLIGSPLESARLTGPNDTWQYYCITSTAPATAEIGQIVIKLARDGGTPVGALYADADTYAPALVVKDHGTAKAAIILYSQDGSLDGDGDYEPDEIPCLWRWDLLGTLVRDYFGVQPAVVASGYDSFMCLPEYRTCKDGSTVWQIKNHRYDATHPTGGVGRTYSLTSSMFEGKTIESLTDTRVIEQNCNGTVSLTIGPDNMTMLHVYDSSAAPQVPLPAWAAASQQSGGSWGDSGWQNRSLRVRVDGSTITRSGDTCYLTLQGRSSGSYIANRVSLVRRDGSTLDGVDETFTQVTFGGSWDAGATVPAGGTITSDPISFDLIEGQDIFVTYWLASGQPSVYLTGGSQLTTWTVPGVDHTATIDWAALNPPNNNNHIYAGLQIEVLGTPEETDVDIDFGDYTIQSYGGGQDGNPTQFEVLDSGATLRMWGNNWKAIALSYNVTTNTIIEFDFEATGAQGEINGIGFDNNLGLSADRLFQIWGTQTWGIQAFRNYSGSGATHYVIPVGQFYTGAMSYMMFANDADAGQATDCRFKNVIVYEQGGGAGVDLAWNSIDQNPGSWGDSGWNNRTYRVLVRGSYITESGGEVYLTLQGRSGSDYTVHRVSLVKRDGTTLNGDDQTFEQITFNGGSWDDGVTIPANGTARSDVIDFNLVVGEDVFVTFWADSANPTVYRSGGTQGNTTWTILGTDHTSTIDWDALTISGQNTHTYAALQLEVNMAGDVLPPIVRLADAPSVVHPMGDKCFAIKAKYDCLDRTNLILHVAFMENGDNGDGEAFEIYQELSTAVTGYGEHEFWMFIPDANQSDSDYISTPDGGNYEFAAWIEDGSDIVAEAVPQETQLKWGVRPTDPLPTSLVKGGTVEIAIEWEDLNEYLPWQSTPLARNEAFPNRVAIFRSSKTENMYPGHFDTVNAVADWLDTMDYESGNQLDILFDNVVVVPSSGSTFFDDFGVGMGNWMRTAGCGNWAVEAGALRASRIGNDDNMVKVVGENWADCSASVDIKYQLQGPYFNDAEFYARFIDRDNFVKISIRNFYSFWRIMGVVKVDGYVVCNKILHNFSKTNSPVEDLWYNIAVVIDGDDYLVSFDGVPLTEGLTVTNFPTGGIALGCRAQQLGIWEPQKGYFFIDDDEYAYYAEEGEPIPDHGTPLNLNFGYLNTFYPTLILPGTYVMSDIEVSNIVTWIDSGLRCLIATDGGVAMKNETGVDDLGRIESLFGVTPFVDLGFDNLTQLLISPTEHYVTLDYEAGEILPVIGNGHPWVSTTTGEALATIYNGAGSAPALIVNTLEDDPLVPKKMLTFNFDVAALGQMTNELTQLTRRAFEWVQGEAYMVTLQLHYNSGNPDFDPVIYTTTGWILSGSGTSTLVVDLPESGIMTGDDMYWVMYVHAWDAEDPWLDHKGFYSSVDDGLVVSIDGQGLQILGATDKAFAGRAWDVWVAYNTTGETVHATFGIKDQGMMEFEDTFSDGDCSDWSLESSGNYSISVTDDGALFAHHEVSSGYSKIRHFIGSGILTNNCSLEFDVKYLTTNAYLAILYQDRGSYSWPSLPALIATADTTGIWHHVELHVYDGVYDQIVNGDVVRANYPLPGLNPNYRDYIGIFCFAGDFLIDNVRHVDEEYSLVPIEITGEMVPTNLTQAFFASVPDYDPDKIDHNGTSEGSEYEWYVQFKENDMECRLDTDVFFAPRLIVEATNFPTTIQPGTVAEVPVDWEALDDLIPAALRIELVDPIVGLTALSSDFLVTTPEGWNEFAVSIPSDVPASHNYLWVAYLYATNSTEPFDECIGLDDTYRFDRFGLPVQPETEITVSGVIRDPYVLYSDMGIIMDAVVNTWGSSVTYDGEHEDPTAPEGELSFYTDARNVTYGAGWGLFKNTDMSSFLTGSLCFWLNSSNTVKIELEGPQGTKRSVNLPSTAGVWVEHELSLTNFSGLDLSNMYGLFAINHGFAGTFCVDHIRWEGRDEQVNTAPVVCSGLDTILFYENGSASENLYGAAADDGLPNDTLNVIWSQISGPGTVVFDDINAMHTGVTFPNTGTYVLRLTAMDSELSSYDETTFLVTSDPAQVNEAPSVYAGSDGTIMVHWPLQLNGYASDDGLPSGELYVSWAKVSGPGEASFADASSLDTTVSFTEAGTYVLRLTADDGQFSDTDDMTVTVEEYTGVLIQNGQSLAGTISVAYEVDDFVFHAQAGEKVKLRMGDRTGRSTFDLLMQLRDPTGALITSVAGENNAEINVDVPMDGYYTVKCREHDSTTGGYALSILWLDPGHELHSSDADIGEIRNGESLTGTINQAGDLDAAYFEATVGDIVYLSMADPSGRSTFDLVMYVYDPDGNYITSTSGDDNAGLITTITNSGTHMVVMRESDVTTGGYVLSLLFLDTGHTLVTDTDMGLIQNGESKVGTINQSGDLDAAYFEATAGDVVYLSMADPSGRSTFDLVMYVYDSDGNYITSTSGDDNAGLIITITNSGSYMVVMKEHDISTGSYVLSILWLDDGHALVGDTDIGTITSGQTINGTINRSGDLDGAFFSASAGDAVTLTMGDRTGRSTYDLLMYLYDPDGQYVASASGESSATISTTITNAGQHTVVLREHDVTTGGYNIALTVIP